MEQVGIEPTYRRLAFGCVIHYATAPYQACSNIITCKLFRLLQSTNLTD